LGEKINFRSLTLNSIKWNAFGQFGYQSISFIVSIALARLLSPAEFGLVAMLFIFSEISNAFINSGLSAALIQKKRITKIESSTIFYFNIIVAFVFYLILFFLAPAVAKFYNEPELSTLIKYYNLAFLIHSISLIQATLLIRELNFKTQNIIQIVGVLFSGIIAIIMAYTGFGVYSLIGQSITFAVTTGVLYWYHSSWRPSFVFDKRSFLELYGFGVKVFLVALLDKIFNAIDNLIIGKLFKANLLGIYNRAKTTKDLPINNVTNIATNIVFPIFSKIESIDELKKIHHQYIRLTAYIILPIMVGLALTAKPFISTIYSNKWIDSAPYLQIFCVFAITIPLNSIMVQTILSRGRSEKFLRLEMIKKAIILSSMIIGAFFGITAFLVALCISYYLAYLITCQFIAKLFNTKIFEIIRLMFSSLLLCIPMGLVVFSMTNINWKNSLFQLISEVFVGIIVYIGFSYTLRQKEFIYLLDLLKERISNKLKAN